MRTKAVERYFHVRDFLQVETSNQNLAGCVMNINKSFFSIMIFRSKQPNIVKALLTADWWSNSYCFPLCTQ